MAERWAPPFLEGLDWHNCSYVEGRWYQNWAYSVQIYFFRALCTIFNQHSCHEIFSCDEEHCAYFEILDHKLYTSLAFPEDQSQSCHCAFLSCDVTCFWSEQGWIKSQKALNVSGTDLENFKNCFVQWIRQHLNFLLFYFKHYLLNFPNFLTLQMCWFDWKWMNI